MDIKQNPCLEGIDTFVKGKISVIVPVYNAEKYLEEAVNSVLHQDYNNFEIILIDDGSTDNSPTICDRLASNHSCIQVLHQPNAGVSVARNAGIDHVTGEYTLFLDADDCLSAKALNILLSSIEENELVVGRWRDVDEKGRLLSESCELTNDTVTADKVKWALFDESQFGYLGLLPGKLFVSKIIKKHTIYFMPGIAYNEDRLFILSYLNQCKMVRLLNEIIYDYRQHNNSAMGALSATFKPKMLTELDAFVKAMEIVKAESDLYFLINRLLFEKALYWYQKIPATFVAEKNKALQIFYASARLLLQSKISLLQKIKVIIHVIAKH